MGSVIVDIPIHPVTVPVEWLMKAERAVEKVRERLLRTAKALSEGRVSYVVIGGNAVAIWVASRDDGAVRNTKDVDILLNRSDLDAAARVMAAAGFDRGEANGITFFLDRSDPVPSRGVHVVFANERLRPYDPHPAPGVVGGILSPEGVQAIGLPELMTLKLMAFRDIDRVHVRDLLGVGLIDDALIAKLPADLRPRLDEILANPDG